MTKLTGQDYIDYWTERMAKGPREAGHRDMTEDELPVQADMFFQEIWRLRQKIETPVARVAELGCGYGRILQRWLTKDPEVLVAGWDLSMDALKGADAMMREHEAVTEGRVWLFEGTELPDGSKHPFDLAYTCTCLQHITDEDYFQSAVRSLANAVKPDGHIIVLENGVHAPESSHIRGKGFADFVGAFMGHGFAALEYGRIMTVMGEPHRAVLLNRV